MTKVSDTATSYFPRAARCLVFQDTRVSHEPRESGSLFVGVDGREAAEVSDYSTQHYLQMEEMHFGHTYKGNEVKNRQ